MTKPHYLNPEWRYNTASSHANAAPFARRQALRRRAAQEAAKVAATNVKPIRKAKGVA